MANEVLTRTPTSSGNRKKFTWAGWIKRNDIDASGGNSYQGIFAVGTVDGAEDTFMFSSDQIRLRCESGSDVTTSQKYRDSGNWMHVMMVVDTTLYDPDHRCIFYVNGVKSDVMTQESDITQNATLRINSADKHYLGEFPRINNHLDGQIADVFLVDGQALTPDVFGFYKDGDGYQSSGTTNATDFRPGQWSPHSPTKIKKDINRRGGFGVNGFYLPMNDSSNPGADFHCDPNSIITLKGEDLPQPRNGAPTTSDAYVSELRSDPYAANLVLAIPFISDGQGNGAGDYSADIKGSGTNKTVTVNGTFSVGDCSSYYGSALKGSSGSRHVAVSAHSDFANLYDVDHTIEFWYKNDAWNGGYLPHNDIISNRHSTNNVAWRISFTDKNNAEDGIQIFGSNGFSSGANTLNNDWNHCAVEQQNGATTLYINGVAAGRNGNKHGYQTYKASTGPIIIGSDGRSANLGDTYSFNGQIQDVRIYKGVAKYKGGFDVSKPYTPVGIEAFRTTTDTCKNNFATLNPLHHGTSIVESDGNLSATWSGSGWQQVTGTVGVSTGKWYWESVQTSLGDQMSGITLTGIGTVTVHMGQTTDQSLGYYGGNGNIYYNSTSVAYGDTWTQNDIIGVAFNATDRQITFYKNGSSQGTVSGYTVGIRTEGTYAPAYATNNSGNASFNFGQNPSFSGTVTAGTNADDSGKGLFKYAPPTGFLALCEDNLPTPAIADPGDHFKTVLYHGDGNDGRSITGVGFKPDFVWIKERDGTSGHYILDSVRGATNYIRPNETNAEDSNDNTVKSFDSNGFTTGDSGAFNASTNNYVAWCWKAGGPAVTNTDGSITSQVSVNQDAGFSIATYTGNAIESTVGHGLNKTPGFIILKKRNGGADWPVYHNSLATQEYLVLNLTNAKATTTELFYQDPTSSVFYIGDASNAINASGGTYIAYCWAEIEGYSKIGSYLGNGDADGPFVYCGFKPAWILIRETTATGNWLVWDSSRKSTNPNANVLIPNLNRVEYVNESSLYLDMLSNGFKIRSTSDDYNTTHNYIFMAFAESPFQTANAK